MSDSEKITDITWEALVAGSQDALVEATRGPTRILVINRPQVRNAMSYDFRRGFAAALSDAEADPAVKVVIVTGASGHFSAGVDLKDHRANPNRPMFRPHPAEALRSMTKPTIAAVDGFCLTGGLEVALSCSFVIATTRAQFADTHAKVGLFPSWGLSALLPSAVGVRRARQMSITGAMIGSSTALAWGLVNEVTSPDDLLPRCMEIAAAIDACDGDSIRLQLEIIDSNEGASLAVALAAEEQAVQRRREQRETSWRSST